jgi:hypothetical protein
MPTKTSGNASVSWTGMTGGPDVGRITANLTQAPIDTTSVNGTFFKYETGLVEGTVDVEMFYLKSVHGVGAMTPGTKLAGFGVTLVSGNTITATSAMVETARVDLQPNDVVRVTATFRLCDGAVTVA